MANYKSKTVVNQPKAKIFEQMSDLRNLEKYKDNFPNNTDLEMQFAQDFISAKVPVLGAATIRLVEKEAQENLKFSVENLPMAANINVKLNEIDSEKTEIQLVLDADIPFFLSKIIGDKLQNGLDKATEMIAETLNR